MWFILRGVVLTCGLSTLAGHNLPGFPVRSLYDISTTSCTTSCRRPKEQDIILIWHTPGRSRFQLCLRDFAFFTLMVVSRDRNVCFDLAGPPRSVGRDVGSIESLTPSNCWYGAIHRSQRWWGECVRLAAYLPRG